MQASWRKTETWTRGHSAEDFNRLSKHRQTHIDAITQHASKFPDAQCRTRLFKTGRGGAVDETDWVEYHAGVLQAADDAEFDQVAKDSA